MPTKRHGMWNSPTYKTWQQMKDRCGNSKSTSYPYYGAKGVTYDPRWEEFKNFLEDMGVRPSGKSLDRLETSQSYCKNNCKWSTPKEQANNRSNNLTVLWEGKFYSPIDLMGVWGKKLPTVYYRIYNFFEYDEDISAYINIKPFKIRNRNASILS